MVLHWEIQWLTTVITMYGKIFRKLRLQGPHGKEAPYKDLPIQSMYHASTKIAEGDYGDCLKMLMTDIEEEKKYKDCGDTAWIIPLQRLTSQTVR